MKHDLHVRSTRLFFDLYMVFPYGGEVSGPHEFGLRLYKAGFVRFVSSFQFLLVYALTYLGIIGRRTFAMYTKFSAWMKACFRTFKGFSLQIRV